MGRTKQYHLPYEKILGTPEQTALEESMHELCSDFRLYDERVFLNAHFKEKIKEVVGDAASPPIVLMRKLLRADLAHKFPEIPEAWFWIHFSRQLWDFELTVDTYYEIKWWIWLEHRGKMQCVNQWGSQNCLGANIPVMMADGTRKLSQDIREGDLLMGPDSTPREVLKLHRGQSPLFRIKPKMGDEWTCTGNHKLELECTRPRTNSKGGANKTHYVGARKKVTVTDYLNWSDSMKIGYKQVHTAIELEAKEQFLDPYVYGLWIGDGGTSTASITSIDEPIKEVWKGYFEGEGYNVREQPNSTGDAVQIFATGGEKYVTKKGGNQSVLLDFIRSSARSGQKFIRDEYMRGSIEQRMKLLAGIIDTDGSADGTNIEITQSNRDIAIQIKQLAESLGYLVVEQEKTTNYTLKSGELATATRIRLSGDFRNLPLRLSRKMPEKNYGKGCRKPGKTGFDVEPIGEGDFYGWTVDKDNMLLLGNGCITNNSGKTFFSGRFPVVQLMVWDAHCIGFISGPYKTHSTDKTWREVKKACNAIRFNPRDLFGIEFKITRDEVSATSPEGTGFIKFVAAQEASSVQGGKSDLHKENGRFGISFFFVDEFIENPYMDLAESFGNYRSNFNSYTVLACNPKPDKIQAPALIAFADPIDIKRTALRKTKHFRWRTRKGTCVRFSWLNCPNRVLNRTQFPYLMNEARKETQAHEEEHIKAAQLDAWGWGAEGASTLTDAQRQIAAGVFSDFYYEDRPHALFLAVDPAFGGSDPAVYTILEAAKVNIGGKTKTRFVGSEQNYIHGIEADFIADLDFVEKVQRLIQYRHRLGDTHTEFLQQIRVGSQVGAMAQGAVLAAILAIDKNVPFQNVTFDASQRADCYDWMVKAFGHTNLTWWYEGSRRLIQEEGDDWLRWPYKTRDDKQHGSRYEKWSDWCGRTITMIWGFGCELINTGYLVDGDKVQKGLDELGAREVASTASGKVDVWSKADIKRGMFQGKKIPKMSSPAWGETLSICLYFATRFHNAVDLGEMPELTQHFGSTTDDDEEWLELAANW